MKHQLSNSLTLFLLSILITISSCSKKYEYPFQNPELSIDERVDDLVSRMTLEEKVSQTLHRAPGIERLGVLPYNWWNECLHGVARAGIATVFPQAIGLGATFNDSLIYTMADVISTEARAKHHEALRNENYGQYYGLTMWSPNINIFRDPRWGRGQETYGEDPYLTSVIGKAFVNGLQGDNENYLKVVATPKHYAVHSGPEPERHVFDAECNMIDMWETYLPAFEATMVEAKAYSIMGAYNRTNGESCCAHPYLMEEVLRGKWGFDGFMVSDCGAIFDIYANHKLVDTEEEAAALAVKRGCDLNCGSVYHALLKAVEKGLITENEIDIAVKRLFKARMKLGMFDPVEMVEYAQIPISKNDGPEHNELALKVAHESIVLLKNEQNTLPLKKDIKSIAVIGPNADAINVLLGNYNGTPSAPVTVLSGIKNAVSEATEIKYHIGCNLAGDEAPLMNVSSDMLSFNDQKGLQAEYFNNIDLTGNPIEVRIDQEINSPWVPVPVDGLPKDEFSVRWSGNLSVNETGEYWLALTGDDGYRMYFEDELVISDWEKQAPQTNSVLLKIEKGKSYPIVIEYFESGGGEELVFSYGRELQDPYSVASDIAKNCDAIIYVGGLSPQLEGEEMEVDIAGFEGGDRTDIELPKPQREMLMSLQKTGKPVICVLLNGSALGIGWEKENIPAIIEAWYPGQNGGKAIADVIFGDYNPAGRLPVTFYKSVDDLPPFRDYNMKNRTYRYFDGEVLYPFGHGLSYTSFDYSDLQIEKENITSAETVKVKVKLTNTGQMTGDEVVQLYIKDVESNIHYRPLKELKGVKRVHLVKGESKILEFEITPRAFSLFDPAKDKYLVEPGEFIVMVGASSEDIRLEGKIVVEE